MAAVIDLEQFVQVRRRAVVLCAAAPGTAPDRVIPGSLVADLDADFSAEHPLPHTVPADPAAAFARFGAGGKKPLVVYAATPQARPAAARLWLLARVAGIRDAAVLDGGLAAWQAAGRPVAEPTAGSAAASKIDAAGVPANWELLADADGVREALRTGSRTVVDLREAARFTGQRPEPDPGLRRGHVPGAVNVAWTDFFGADGRLADVEALRDLLEPHLGPAGAVTFMSGTGVSACVGALAAGVAGYGDVEVYEGSFAEWAHPTQDPSEFPVVR